MALAPISREVRDSKTEELLGWIVQEKFPINGKNYVFALADNDGMVLLGIKHVNLPWMYISHGHETYVAIGADRHNDLPSLMLLPGFIPFQGMREVPLVPRPRVAETDSSLPHPAP